MAPPRTNCPRRRATPGTAVGPTGGVRCAREAERAWSKSRSSPRREKASSIVLRRTRPRAGLNRRRSWGRRSAAGPAEPNEDAPGAPSLADGGPRGIVPLERGGQANRRCSCWGGVQQRLVRRRIWEDSQRRPLLPPRSPRAAPWLSTAEMPGSACILAAREGSSGTLKPISMVVLEWVEGGVLARANIAVEGRLETPRTHFSPEVAITPTLQLQKPEGNRLRGSSNSVEGYPTPQLQPTGFCQLQADVRGRPTRWGHETCCLILFGESIWIQVFPARFGTRTRLSSRFPMWTVNWKDTVNEPVRRAQQPHSSSSTSVTWRTHAATCAPRSIRSATCTWRPPSRKRYWE